LAFTSACSCAKRARHPAATRTSSS
jgi:hypothetical protein